MIKRSRLVLKCRPFKIKTEIVQISNVLVIRCPGPAENDHSNTGLVRYSDHYCIYFWSILRKFETSYLPSMILNPQDLPHLLCCTLGVLAAKCYLSFLLFRNLSMYLSKFHACRTAWLALQVSEDLLEYRHFVLLSRKNKTCFRQVSWLVPDWFLT